jgi:hypothetical protein
MNSRIAIVVALLSGSVSLGAQDTPTSPQAQSVSGTVKEPAAPATDDASSVLLAPRPTGAPSAPAPEAPRAASPGIAADIDASLPKYSPLAATPKESTVVAQGKDFDKPRNVIPRLPLEVMNRYVVHQARMPVFRENDLYTREGLIALSFRAHPGLRIGNFFNLNSKAAYAAIQKDEKFAARQDLVDTTFAMAVGGDMEETAVLKEAIEDESFREGGQEGPFGIK